MEKEIEKILLESINECQPVLDFLQEVELDPLFKQLEKKMNKTCPTGLLEVVMIIGNNIIEDKNRTQT